MRTATISGHWSRDVMPYQKAVIDQRGAEVNVGRASERRDKLGGSQ